MSDPRYSTDTVPTTSAGYPSTGKNYSTVSSPDPFSMSYLSSLVIALLCWQTVCYFAWFVVEIAIHSESDQSGVLVQLAFQSMNIYTHEGIIVMGTLFALVYADLVKTRAARVMSAVVQMFGLLAWFWELYFIIPSFRGNSDGQNVFCSNTLENKWCMLTRAASALAVALQFGQTLIVLYALANMFIIPVADDGTVKEVEEVDDAEVDAFVAAQPAVYGTADAAEKATGLAVLGLVAFSLTGYAILVFASIQLAKDTGLAYILADVVLSDMFRQLSLLLVFSLAVSSYSALRRNRCITAGALFLTVLSAFQWFSFFIEACRRFNNEPDNANTAFFDNASKTVIAGSGIITCIQTILALGLVCRYYFYVPVQKTHVVPTYQTGAFDFVNPFFALLFITQAIATVVWWVLEVVLESDSNLFTDDPNSSAIFVTDRMFIYQCMFFAAVFIPAFYAEKWRNVGSFYSAIMVNIVVILGYFLLVWPWSYNTVYRSGLLNDQPQTPSGQSPGATGVVSLGFCSNSQYGNDICRLVQGAAILSVITGGLYVILAFYQLVRIALFAMNPTDGSAAINADGTMVAQMGLPPVMRKNEFVNISLILCVAGLAVWSLASIGAVSRDNNDSFNAYSLGNRPIQQTGSGSNNQDFNLNFFYSYMYQIAYPVIVSLGFTAWFACEISQNAYESNRFGWRLAAAGLSTLCFYFYLPGLIYVARYVNDSTLGDYQKAEAAGGFILSSCSFLLMLSTWYHLFSNAIPVPDRTATVITRDIQLNDVKVDPLNKGAQITTAAAIADGYAPANQRDIADTTVVENRDASYNSTVNVH